MAKILSDELYAVLKRMEIDYLAGRLTNRPQTKEERRTRTSSSGFYAIATTGLTQGPQPPGTTVAENTGPAWGSGTGESTGKNPEVHFVHFRDIEPGEWVWCQRTKGKVYVSPVECPPEEEVTA